MPKKRNFQKSQLIAGRVQPWPAFVAKKLAEMHDGRIGYVLGDAILFYCRSKVSKSTIEKWIEEYRKINK